MKQYVWSATRVLTLFVLIVLALASDAIPSQAEDQMRDEYLQLGISDPNVFSDSVQHEFGSRLGYGWVDRSGEQLVLRITLVNANSADQVRLDALTGSNPLIRVQDVRFSRTDLEGFADAIYRVMKGLPYYVAVSNPMDTPQRIHVEVTKDPPNSVKQSVYAVAPRDIVDFVIAGSELALEGSGRYAYPPYKGGLSLGMGQPEPPPFAYCTSGFTVKNELGTVDFGTTAGHCGVVHQEVYNGQLNICHVEFSYSEVDPVLSDTLIFCVTQSPAPQAKIYTGEQYGLSQYISVENKYTDTALANSTAFVTLCFSGGTSLFEQCGNLDTVRHNVSADGIVIEEAWCWGNSNDPANAVIVRQGDSGSAVYHKNTSLTGRAAGWVSFGETIWPYGGCFTSIDPFMSESGLRLKFAP